VADENQTSTTPAGDPAGPVQPADQADSEALDGDQLIPVWIPPELETTKAHPARIYEYLLGGKHYFDIDREAAEEALRHVPQGRAMVQENRAFLTRAVRFLAESGITQFLDLGSGLPGTSNLGDVARAVHPNAGIVYVDYDPMVAVHARALLAGADPAHTAVVHGDVRQPEVILGDPETRRVLDFERPIALIMAALLHFVTAEEDPRGIVAAFLDAVPPGSALVITHLTDGGQPAVAREARKAWDGATSRMTTRTAEEIRALFDGTEIVEPGVVPRPLWRPDGEVREDWAKIWGLAGVGFKR
jgi:hypothetical protein